MKTDNDKLRELFKQQSSKELSADFDCQLMRKITKLAETKARKRKMLRLLLAAFAGIGGFTALLSIIWFLFYHYKIKFDAFQHSLAGVDFKIPKTEFPPMLVILAVAVLFLLCVDMLISRHRFSKEQKSNTL